MFKLMGKKYLHFYAENLCLSKPVYYITGVVLSSPIAAPAWPSTYSVQGMLHLPYAEINEPFSGYFDANNKKSRVDYYNGK